MEHNLKMVTTKEVAILLSVSVSCIFNYVRQGKLKAYRLTNGATRYKLSDIQDFINAGGK